MRLPQPKSWQRSSVIRHQIFRQRAFVARHASFDARQLAASALAALDLALSDSSELSEFWSENAEDYPAWRAIVTDLRERIASAT